MKKRVVYIVFGILLGCLMVTDGWAQEMSSDNFEQLKKLEGEWIGVKPDGKKVEVSYKVMSRGSAIIETMIPEGEPSMVSVYHMNGDKLMMTHYCSAGNQPRMEVSAAEDGNLDFRFVDATNLSSSSQGHMTGLKVIFVDDNHFNQVWTWSEGDKEMPGTFEYERKS
ncbi:hypothetical protein NC796_22645 [Aliifodinibius sp. S!AR15-10]|uniref:hypothetical protein n=1 Tax=Aliifodinibius sp. S!AR15-10 TaxID=2950437 RepID=UPI002854979F|nr:hypothetical protein [Aliifodinibius sp. S!AR15-10]MDR8393971.1 hypothetical protein [Aliifodinibius sp. S!AR15-10]